PIRPKEVTPAQFSEINENDLLPYDCIYLCDVGQLGAGDVRRLEHHLRRGGGLIISAGDRSAEQLETLERLLYKNGQGLLPAKLVKKITVPGDRHSLLHAAEAAYQDPPLKAFAHEDDRASLRRARFRQYVQAKLPDNSPARVFLAFNPEVDKEGKGADPSMPSGDPAFIEWNPPLPRSQQESREKVKGVGIAGARYRGKVILFTSTFNMD